MRLYQTHIFSSCIRSSTAACPAGSLFLIRCTFIEEIEPKLYEVVGLVGVLEQFFVLGQHLYQDLCCQLAGRIRRILTEFGNQNFEYSIHSRIYLISMLQVQTLHQPDE